MFTGIVQTVAKVVSLDGHKLRVNLKTPPHDIWPGDPLQEGESISIDGCCLTLVKQENQTLRFDLSEETVSRTRADQYVSGVPVNLERAMKANDRFGGHIVQGHVDSVGKLVSIDEHDQSWTLAFSFLKQYGRYIIEKGSVTVNGISLTVVNPTQDRFEVAIIPHTWRNTALNELNPGEKVNLEFDLIAKYVEKLTAHAT